MQNPNPDKISEKINERDVLEISQSYPFPIAFYVKKIADSETNLQKLCAVFEALESMISYMDLLMLALYLQKKEYEPNIQAAAHRLECPCFDDWYQFLSVAVAHLPDTHSLISQIKKWYESVVNKKEIYIQEVVDYKKVETELGTLKNLKDIQEKLIPVLHIMLDNEIAAYYQFCYSSLIKILKNLSFLKEYPLLAFDNTSESKSAKKLIGATRNFQSTPIYTKQPIVGGQVYLYDPGTQQYCSLHPFIIYQECYYCIREELHETWEVLLFYGRTSSRIAYHGCVHNIALREQLGAYQTLCQNQPKEQLSVKDIWERAFQATE